jgi:small subunit ribosomal protein S2
VHFGHRTRRWNPKMKPFIFTERKGVHIIDLQQTIAALTQACDLVQDTVAAGGMVLFVGTKRQAQETIFEEARRCEMPYVNQRWLGGTLTNWRTIRQRIEYLQNLEARRDRGDFERLKKKEALGLERQIEKLNERLGGIREMRDLPDLLYVVDVRREATAVAEANKLGIPIIAIVDTNCDPDPIDYVIPGNDDAIRATKLISSKIADAVRAGLDRRKAAEPEGFEVEEIGVEDEKYLSAATLARLRELTFQEEEEAVPAAEAAPAEQVIEGDAADQGVVAEVVPGEALTEEETEAAIEAVGESPEQMAAEMDQPEVESVSTAESEEPEPES